MGRHLDATYDSPETQDDIKLLRAQVSFVSTKLRIKDFFDACTVRMAPSHYSFLQVEEDLENGIPGAVPIPPDDAGKNDVIAALVANVEAMIKADRKITSLKQLQVSEESTFKSYFPFLQPSFFAHSITIYKIKF